MCRRRTDVVAGRQVVERVGTPVVSGRGPRALKAGTPPSLWCGAHLRCACKVPANNWKWARKASGSPLGPWSFPGWQVAAVAAARTATDESATAAPAPAPQQHLHLQLLCTCKAQMRALTIIITTIKPTCKREPNNGVVACSLQPIVAVHRIDCQDL